MMNRHFLTGAVIVTCLCLVTGVSYACVPLGIAIWNTYNYVEVSNDSSNTVSVTADVDYGGPVTTWDWSWSSGLVGTVTQTNDDDSTAEFWSDTAGTYTVDVDAWNSSGSNDDAWAYVKVVEVTSIASGDDVLAVGEEMTFGAITYPLNCHPYVDFTWSAEGGSPSTGSGSLFTTSWNSPGYETVTVYCGDSSAQKNVTVVELKSQTVSTAPVNRSRTLLGIGEKVTCWVEPSINVFWTVAGNGGSLDKEGEWATSATFTAVKSNDTPKYPTVTAQLPGPGSDCTLDFEIIKPTGETNVFLTDINNVAPGPPNLYMGHWHVFTASVQPTTVSFLRVQFRENVPLNEWVWPDDTEESWGPNTYPFSVVADNSWTDQCAGYDRHVSLLNDPIEGPVDFEMLLSIPEEFQDDNGNWHSFLPNGKHKHEFRASDYKSKGTILDDNVPSGQSWMPPYETEYD